MGDWARIALGAQEEKESLQSVATGHDGRWG
jgi:hypothetical protein